MISRSIRSLREIESCTSESCGAADQEKCHGSKLNVYYTNAGIVKLESFAGKQFQESSFVAGKKFVDLVEPATVYSCMPSSIFFSVGFEMSISSNPLCELHLDPERKGAHTSKDFVPQVAWEAPLVVPKVSLYAHSRYARAVPVWELQAPDNWFTLSTLLKIIELEVDAECVLTVRKIHKLGLNSANILRDHFSRFGEVERVMLLPSRPKSSPMNGGTSFVKIRPASMAFVVMRSRQPAIIARLNEVHLVEEHSIQVQKFRQDHTDNGDVDTPMNSYAWLDEICPDYTPPAPSSGRKNSYPMALF